MLLFVVSVILEILYQLCVFVYIKQERNNIRLASQSHVLTAC